VGTVFKLTGNMVQQAMAAPQQESWDTGWQAWHENTIQDAETRWNKRKWTNQLIC
jgi:hypothetical protein